MSVQISEKHMDRGVFNISSAKLCSKLISVELEVMIKKWQGQITE